MSWWGRVLQWRQSDAKIYHSLSPEYVKVIMVPWPPIYEKIRLWDFSCHEPLNKVVVVVFLLYQSVLLGCSNYLFRKMIILTWAEISVICSQLMVENTCSEDTVHIIITWIYGARFRPFIMINLKIVDWRVACFWQGLGDIWGDISCLNN